MRNSTDWGLGEHDPGGNGLTRRGFLKSALASTGAVLLAACAPAAQPVPTAVPAKPAPAPTAAPAKPADAPAPKPAAPAPTGAPAAAAKPAGPQPEVVQVTDDLIKAAKAEGTLTLRYSSPVDVAEAMAKAFTAKFGIKLQLDRKVGVVGNQQFSTEERAGQHIVDVNWTTDPPGLRKLGEEGLYLNWTLADLKNIMPDGTYIEGWGYGTYWNDIIISYNPKLIPHAEAKELFKTWKGLLDPKLKGMIGMTEPAAGGVPFGTYLMFYQRPEYGRDFMVKLAAQNPRLYPASAGGREDLRAGAISVFIPSWESIEVTEYMKGGQTAWTYPEISPAFANVYVTISKQAPHPNAARLFAAWSIIMPEGGKARERADLRPILNGWTDTREGITKLKQVDWWKPFPENIRWVPDRDYWDANFDRLSKDMREILGWKG